MATFPLAPALAALHDDVLRYATAVQNTIAEAGGCNSLSSEALNVLAFNAVLAHRGVRTLCEEGWTPLTPIVNRTLLDVLLNCIAVLNRPEVADYMGFKYLSEFHRKWLTDPEITDPERTEANATLDRFVGRLQAADQNRARELIREARPNLYWFRPEYNTTRDLLDLSPHNIHVIYKLFSGVTHGGISAKFLFDDDPAAEEIGPRQHPRHAPQAVLASSRLLLEVSYVRDRWENFGVGEEIYRELVARLIALR